MNNTVIILDFDGTFYGFVGGKTFKESKSRENLITTSLQYIKSLEKSDLTDREIQEIFEDGLKSPQGIAKFLAQKYGRRSGEYYLKTWGKLEPKQCIITYLETKMTLEKLFVAQNVLIILTRGPRVWVEKALSYLQIPIKIFIKIITAEKFINYHDKEDIFNQIVKDYPDKIIIAVGDEEKDIAPAKKLGLKTLLFEHPRDMVKLLNDKL